MRTRTVQLGKRPSAPEVTWPTIHRGAGGGGATNLPRVRVPCQRQRGRPWFQGVGCTMMGEKNAKPPGRSQTQAGFPSGGGHPLICYLPPASSCRRGDGVGRAHRSKHHHQIRVVGVYCMNTSTSGGGRGGGPTLGREGRRRDWAGQGPISATRGHEGEPGRGRHGVQGGEGRQDISCCGSHQPSPHHLPSQSRHTSPLSRSGSQGRRLAESSELRAPRHTPPPPRRKQ